MSKKGFGRAGLISSDHIVEPSNTGRDPNFDSAFEKYENNDELSQKTSPDKDIGASLFQTHCQDSEDGEKSANMLNPPPIDHGLQVCNLNLGSKEAVATATSACNLKALWKISNPQSSQDQEDYNMIGQLTPRIQKSEFFISYAQTTLMMAATSCLNHDDKQFSDDQPLDSPTYTYGRNTYLPIVPADVLPPLISRIPSPLSAEHQKSRTGNKLGVSIFTTSLFDMTLLKPVHDIQELVHQQQPIDKTGVMTAKVAYQISGAIIIASAIVPLLCRI
ncbi:hypothetical protein B0J11DRAFT_582159 [Dendryphion nanum]|uniref:Uncharacterized protein n=1 Tax=Dendryphion nanum TaxID=256645 RepID=A0A9P9IHM1_9PLEO|nr:hypothetical protein B0J11DRAFT_582159 [Dendryphion nanum]